MASRIVPPSGEMTEPEKRRAFRPSDIWIRFGEQQGRCALCPALIQYAGGPRSILGAVHFEADHITPRDLYGKTNLENLQLICVPCHSKKTTERDRPMIDKARRLRKKADPATRKTPSMVSRGFQSHPTLRRGMDGKVRER